MITVEKFFANLFNHPNISRRHLLGFAIDYLARLAKANTSHQYDVMIAYLTPLVAAFATEVGNEDIALNLRKTQTNTVDQTSYNFGNTMSSLEGVIAYTLGGKTSEGYMEFYPHGLSEYNHPTREAMPVLVNRINLITGKYATPLGSTIAGQLLAIGTSFNAARTAQVSTNADLAQSKIAISTNRLALELGMTKGLHELAAMYPGNIVACNGLVNFNLLYSFTQHQHDVHDGTLVAEGTVDVLNRTMTDTVSIEVNNNGTNAPFWVWLGATATDTNNLLAVKVMPGHTVVLKPSDIGGPEKTFLLIKNDSSVNAASYIVTIIG